MSVYVHRALLYLLHLLLAVLRPLALLVDIASAPLHATWFPFPLASTLHAMRMAHLYKSTVVSSGQGALIKERGLGVELAGYLTLVSDILWEFMESRRGQHLMVNDHLYCSGLGRNVYQLVSSFNSPTSIARLDYIHPIRLHLPGRQQPSGSRISPHPGYA